MEAGDPSVGVTAGDISVGVEEGDCPGNTTEEIVGERTGVDVAPSSSLEFLEVV